MDGVHPFAMITMAKKQETAQLQLMRT
jgi:hypothetical protein